MRDGQGFIFVSHSSANRAAAEALAAQLEGEGARIWIAPRDVVPGRDYSEQLDEAIAGCAALVLVASAAAASSPAVRGEAEQAARDGKPIFPVRLADVDVAAAFPMLGGLKYWTDGFGPNAARNVGRLAEELVALAAPAPAGPPPAPAPAPAPVAIPSIPDAPPAPPFAPPLPAAPPAPSMAPPAPAYVPPPAVSAWPGTGSPALHAFIGNNAERYQRVFYKMEASQSALSWNWPAFLANFIWLAHRRLFVPAGIVAAIVLASILIGGTFRGQTGLMALFGVGIPTLVAAGVGMFGDHLLKKRADTVIPEMQYRYPDPHSHLAAIAASGGTSMPATIGVTVAWLALIVGLQSAGLTPFERTERVYYYRY